MECELQWQKSLRLLSEEVTKYRYLLKRTTLCYRCHLGFFQTLPLVFLLPSSENSYSSWLIAFSSPSVTCSDGDMDPSFCCTLLGGLVALSHMLSTLPSKLRGWCGTPLPVLTDSFCLSFHPSFSSFKVTLHLLPPCCSKLLTYITNTSTLVFSRLLFKA